MSPPAAVQGLAGLVLAAGAGRRMGAPKALMRDASGTSWITRAVDALGGADCTGVVVVLGAGAEEALHLVPRHADVVLAREWESGLGASLRAGLDALDGLGTPGARPEAAVVTLVDLPEQTPAAVARLAHGAGPTSLRRASFGGRPGHPVVLGGDHWPALRESLDGDTGAGPYLNAHGVEEIDCTDLGGGHDVDSGRWRIA